MEKKVIKKQTIITGLIVAFWLCLTLFILNLFNIHDGWPAYLVLTLFTLGSKKIESLKPIFIGSAVGILIAVGIVKSVTFLTLNLGINKLISTLIIVFIAVFLIIVLEDLTPSLFNGYSFIYFTIALIPAEQAVLTWLITLFAGGAFFVGGIILLLKLTARLGGDKDKSTKIAHMRSE